MCWRGEIAPRSLDNGDGSDDERRLFDDGVRAVLSFLVLLQALPKGSGPPYLCLLFHSELKKHIKVDWMGKADYFLGTAFEWMYHENGHLSIHLTQTAFTEHTAHRFGVYKMNKEPNMTPYRSGYPIDFILSSDKDDPDQNRHTKVYQRVVGSTNWLATCTQPDIAPVLTCLASYQNAPHHQHYKAAIHALKYLYSTSEYGILYHSNSANTIQAFNHFPHHHDKEAYTDATPLSPSECHQLTEFTYACGEAKLATLHSNWNPS